MRSDARKVVALLLLVFALAACRHDPGIIKYPTPMTNLKAAPHDTTQEDKNAAAQTHTQLGIAYMQQGRLKQAETALHKAVQFDDKYVPAHTMLAVLNWHINRTADADKQFRAAIALDPTDGDTNNNYGKFLCSQGKQEDAMRHFKRALADPFYKTPALAATNAGQCLLQGSHYADAAPYLHKALKMDVTFGPALLAMAELDYRNGDAFHARGYLQRFESGGAATPQSLLLGHQIATRLGDNPAAASYASRLRDQFPDSTQAQSLNGPNP